MDILFGIIILLFGIFVGFALKYELSKSYVGSIVVSKRAGKTIYSLELDDYLEKIESAKKVTFKVVNSDENQE